MIWFIYIDLVFSLRLSYSLTIYRDVKDKVLGPDCSKIIGVNKRTCICNEYGTTVISIFDHLDTPMCYPTIIVGCDISDDNEFNYIFITEHSVIRKTLLNLPKYCHSIERILLWNVDSTGNQGVWMNITGFAAMYFQLSNRSELIISNFTQHNWKGQVIKVVFGCEGRCAIIKVKGIITYPFELHRFMTTMKALTPKEITHKPVTPKTTTMVLPYTTHVKTFKPGTRERTTMASIYTTGIKTFKPETPEKTTMVPTYTTHVKTFKPGTHERTTMVPTYTTGVKTFKPGTSERTTMVPTYTTHVKTFKPGTSERTTMVPTYTTHVKTFKPGTRERTTMVHTYTADVKTYNTTIAGRTSKGKGKQHGASNNSIKGYIILALVVPLTSLLSFAIIYTYRRCRICKKMFARKKCNSKKMKIMNLKEEVYENSVFQAELMIQRNEKHQFDNEVYAEISTGGSIPRSIAAENDYAIPDVDDGRANPYCMVPDSPNNHYSEINNSDMSLPYSRVNENKSRINMCYDVVGNEESCGNRKECVNEYYY